MCTILWFTDNFRSLFHIQRFYWSNGQTLFPLLIENRPICLTASTSEYCSVLPVGTISIITQKNKGRKSFLRFEFHPESQRFCQNPNPFLLATRNLGLFVTYCEGFDNTGNIKSILSSPDQKTLYNWMIPNNWSTFSVLSRRLNFAWNGESISIVVYEIQILTEIEISTYHLLKTVSNAKFTVLHAICEEKMTKFWQFSRGVLTISILQFSF